MFAEVFDVTLFHRVGRHNGCRGDQQIIVFEKSLGTGIDSGTLGHRAGDIICGELESFFNVPDNLGFEGFALFFQGMAMPNGITERAKGLKDVL